MEKEKKVETHKGKCSYLLNIDLKSSVLLGKNKKNNKNPTISIPNRAYFHLIFKWFLFYVQ